MNKVVRTIRKVPSEFHLSDKREVDPCVYLHWVNSVHGDYSLSSGGILMSDADIRLLIAEMEVGIEKHIEKAEKTLRMLNSLLEPPTAD